MICPEFLYHTARVLAVQKGVNLRMCSLLGPDGQELVDCMSGIDNFKCPCIDH